MLVRLILATTRVRRSKNDDDDDASNSKRTRHFGEFVDSEARGKLAIENHETLVQRECFRQLSPSVQRDTMTIRTSVVEQEALLAKGTWNAIQFITILQEQAPPLFQVMKILLSDSVNDGWSPELPDDADEARQHCVMHISSRECNPL